MDAREHTDPLVAEGHPPADPAYVERLAALRPEPLADGDPPTAADLERILSTALTVPDHGDLTPWRFAVCTGSGRDRFARALREGLHELRGDDVPGAAVAKMSAKAHAAPCSVMVIASPDPSSNVEGWEQVVSASCTGYALVLAATGLGYGAVWKSAGVLGTGPVRALFDCTPDEVLLGWVNLGPPAPLGRKGLIGRGADADLGSRVLRIDA
jgi:nitroreductase